MLPTLSLLVALQDQVDPNRLPIGPAGEVTIKVGDIANLETGKTVKVADIVKAARGKRYVFLGENHATLDHQRMQAKIIAALVKDGRQVAVGLEMYTRPKQEWLDQWSAGGLTSTDFQAKSDWQGQWGYPYYYYSPVFDVVKANKLPLIGLNVPRDWVRAVGRGGFAALPAEAKPQLPADVGQVNPQHRTVFDALIGGHPGSSEAMNNMYSGQVLWDEGMADTAMKFVAKQKEDPKQIFVVIAGSGHVLYKQAINYRIKTRSGADGVTVVMLQDQAPATVSKGIGDFAYVSEADREVGTAIPTGRGKMSIEVAKETKIDAYTYKPANYNGGPIVVVFHGTLRNADEYRADAEDLARKWGALVVAPKFDAARFPGRKYNYGGILNEDKTAAPKEEWTYAMVPKIVDAIRQKEGNPRLPYYLIGHSAGGQFLVRMAAFMQDGATRIIAANPGSELFPTTDQQFGYGYGGLPPELSDEATIKRYLAQPLTILLGLKDDHPDEYFDDSPAAMAQGKSRVERGKNVFAYAKALAKKNNWPFNWRLGVVPDVGHDHKKMFDSFGFATAFAPSK